MGWSRGGAILPGRLPQQPWVPAQKVGWSQEIDSPIARAAIGGLAVPDSMTRAGVPTLVCGSLRHVVELDVLQALDALQWLGSGEEVAKRFGVSQSTVSRHCAKALRVFGLTLQRRQGEWDLCGDQTYLQLERHVHQQARWLGQRPLRLEATYWSAPVIRSGLPAGWILGRSDIVGIKRNLQLVQDRIVDGWIAGLPDLPTAAQPELTALVLTRMPVFFTCAPGHPLLDRGSLTYADIRHYPTLALPAGSYPLVEDALKRIGLWNDEVRMRRYRRDRWEGKTEAELTIGYGTPLSMHVSGGRLCRLPLELPFDSGDALVVHREFLGHPRLEELVSHLERCFSGVAEQVPAISMTSRPGSDLGAPMQVPHKPGLRLDHP